VVDVKGTCCPYPQLKTKVALDQMRPGEVLRVLTDDRATADNIRIAVEQLEDAVLGIEEKRKRGNLYYSYSEIPTQLQICPKNEAF